MQQEFNTPNLDHSGSVPTSVRIGEPCWSLEDTPWIAERAQELACRGICCLPWLAQQSLQHVCLMPSESVDEYTPVPFPSFLSRATGHCSYR